MKIFIQSTSLEEIRQIAGAGLMDGVMLSTASAANADPTDDLQGQLSMISRAFAVPICVPVTGLAEADIYREGRELARLSDHVIVQIPFIEDAIVPIRRLVADGVKVCTSYICSGAQAFLAAKMGASMLSVQVEDLDAQGHESAECHLAVASPRSSRHFTACLLAGADVTCIAPEALRTLMIHSLTDRGIDRFLSDMSRRRKPLSVS
jgi:transaldolase